MSRMEKIAFISSFWSLFNVKGKLEYCSDLQLDKIIKGIVEKVRNNKALNAIIHVNQMPIFLN